MGDSLQQAKKRREVFYSDLNHKTTFIKETNCRVHWRVFHLGHIEKVPTSELIKPVENCYYLSHHCVIKCNQVSANIKFRVVFDGSTKTTTGVFPNNKLLVGTKFWKEFLSIMFQFQLHQVALSADIAKIYRQVELDKEDKNCHRFLWKDPNLDGFETYLMTRVTHFIASSSFFSARHQKVFH